MRRCWLALPPPPATARWRRAPWAPPEAGVVAGSKAETSAARNRRWMRGAIARTSVKPPTDAAGD